VNTRINRPGGEQLDLLATQDRLRRWLSEEDDRLTPPAGAVDLKALHKLREHITLAVERARHGAAPPTSALRALNDAQRAAPAYWKLAWDGAGVIATPRRSGDDTLDLLAELAEAATDLLADPSIRKVRLCEGPECRLLFLPAHPRRRWCSPALCGNRVRVARYYQRHKGPSPD
jgi:predicted RNA-binding Zn ribbon-like protein